MGNCNAKGINTNSSSDFSNISDQSIQPTCHSQQSSNMPQLIGTGYHELLKYKKIKSYKLHISDSELQLTHIEFKRFKFKLKNLFNINGDLHTEKNLLGQKIILLKNIESALYKLIPLYEGKIQNAIERRTESPLIFQERHKKYTKKIERANKKMEKLEAKIMKSDLPTETTPPLQ